MGTVKPIYGDDGKPRAYQARWRDAAGVQRKRQFRLKRDADQHLRDAEGERDRGGTGWDRRVTNSELVAEYIDLQAPNLAANSIASMRSRWSSNIDGTTLGRQTAFSTRWSGVQKWADQVRAGNAHATTEATLALLRSAYKVAVRDQRIPASPAAHRILIAEDEDQAPFVALEVDDAARVLAALPPLLRMVGTVQAHAGLRVQEALGLLVDDVDLDERVLRVRKQIGKRSRRREKLKTAASARDVTMGAYLSERLRAWIAAQDLRAGWLFADAGGPIGYDVYRWALMKAGRQARAVLVEQIARGEVEAGRDLSVFDSVQTHDFRHHHASVLIAANVPLLVIARRLGHSSVRQIEKTYGHMLRGTDELTREALDRAWSGH